MAKRIAFSILCTLLVLVVILTGIVIRRVSRIMLWSATPDPVPTDAPSAPATDPGPGPTDATDPTQPQHEHTFVLTNVINATCEGYGWNIYTCSDCGFVDMPIAEQQNPLGHNYNEGEIIPPTCTDGGHTVYTCLRCIRIVTEDETEPLGHAFDLPKDVEPTCTEDGYTVICCSREGCVEVQETIVHEGTAKGHTFGAWSYMQDGMAEPFCCVCYAEWTGSSGGLPTDVYAILSHQRSDLTHPSKGHHAFYEIHVGISNQPDAPSYHYTIFDYLDNYTLLFYYDPQLGLVIRYNDQDDIPRQIILNPETSGSATIHAPEAAEEPQ